MKIVIFFSLLLLYFAACVNPFAPSINEDLENEGSILSDQKTVEGVFQNFKYAYTFKDTTIYGNLLAHDFTFMYRDYDAGFDKSWGRDEEMKVTHGLFQNSERLDLIWNNILLISNDSTNIVRSFNLTITFSPTDMPRIDGKVNLSLRKESNTGKWQIYRWVDESNF